MSTVMTFLRGTGVILFFLTTIGVLLLWATDGYKNYQVDYQDNLPQWQYIE